MKAYRFINGGAIEHLTLHDEPMLQPQRSEVLIRVRAVSLNYRDLAMIKGSYPRGQRAGLIPVSDAAGEVVAVGADVDRFSVGARVINSFHPRWYAGAPPSTLSKDSYGSARDGWLVEYKTVNQEALVPCPSHLSFEEASTLPCADSRRLHSVDARNGWRFDLCRAVRQDVGGARDRHHIQRQQGRKTTNTRRGRGHQLPGPPPLGREGARAHARKGCRPCCGSRRFGNTSAIDQGGGRRWRGCADRLPRRLQPRGGFPGIIPECSINSSQLSGQPGGARGPDPRA